MEKDSRGKGKNSSQSSQKGGLPKKTKPAGDSPSLPPASTERLSGQDGQLSSATDASSSEDTLSESTETEGQSDTEVLEQEPAQQPARMKMTNKGSKGCIQALSGNDRLRAIGARTTANLERACPQGYVRTRSYYRALSVVTKQGTCILTGSSGSGKTTLARHLLLHFREEGFLPLELFSPDECECVPWHKVGKDKYKLVLLVDNVLGAGNYEDELRRKWGTQLEAMRPYIDQGHVKVILASRANIYAQIRDVKGSRELLQEAPEVAVGGGDCRLTDWEKTEIFKRALAFHKVKLPDQISLKRFILASTETAKLGYPQMCVHLAKNERALSDPVAFVQNPLLFLDEEFFQLQLNDLASYYVLILVLLKEGNLAESFLKDASNKAFMSQVAEMVGLSVALGFGQIQKLAEDLCESYLEYNSQSKCFSFSHDSIWDCLFTHLCQSDFDKAVQVCTWKQLLLYVRTDPKSKDKEDFVYLVPEANWPILAKRLLQELTCGDADLACSHPCLQHPDFVRWLLETFLTDKHIQKILESTEKEEKVVTDCQVLHPGFKDVFSDLSCHKVNIFCCQFPSSFLILRKCPAVAKHILKSKKRSTFFSWTIAKLLEESLACALYVSDSDLVDWLLAIGAKVSEECVRAACCAEQEHVGLVERALQEAKRNIKGRKSIQLLTEMARVASQMDRPRTLELVLSHLPRSESTQAELDLILAELICITHPRNQQCKKLTQLANMLSILKKAGAHKKPLIDQFIAAGHFDPTSLSEWLEQKVDLSATDEGGNTLLHHAAKYGALGNVQALLGCMDSMSQRDQLVNARNKNRDTALHLAAEEGHLAVVDVLLRNGGDANLTNENNKTALLMVACCQKWNVEGYTFPSKVEGASSSYSHGQQTTESDNSVRQTMRTLVLNTAALNHSNHDLALHQASQCGHTVLVEVLVENGADVNSRGYNKTSVHHAAERGHVGVLEVLCANRAQLDARDRWGQSALHLAARQGHLSVVEMLMGNKVNVDAQDASMTTPLHAASERGHVEIVRCLLDKGASVSVTDTEGRQPLHLAAGGGHFPVVECLLDGGACVNAQDKEDATSLHFASGKGDASTVELLLTHSASVNVQNDLGSTPLHLASDEGHTSTVELLLTHGASVNAKDALGMTPLHLTLKNGKWSVAELLMQAGADKTITAKNGDTSLHSLAAWNSEIDRQSYCSATPPSFSLVESLGDLAECKNNKGDTPIMVAAKCQNWKVFCEMLKLQCDLSVTDREGNTALHLAVTQNKEMPDSHGLPHLKACSEDRKAENQCVSMMVEKCVKHLNIQNREGDTPLLLAARAGNTNCLGNMLKYHLNLDFAVKGKGGNTILHEVSCNLHDWSMKYFLSERRNVELLARRCADLVNCPNDDGDTPILMAARTCRWHLLSLLLKQKCDVRACDKRGNTLLHCLAEYTPPEELETTARAVIGDLAEIVDSANEDENTALILAAGRGNVWMVRELLKLQCNVRLTNKHGETALYLATRNGHTSVMELLGQDVDVSIQTKEGNTVLHALAALGGLKYMYGSDQERKEKVRSLVEKCRSVINCPNSSGKTPLYVAVDNLNFLVMEVLLGQNVDVSFQTKEGNTILHALAARESLDLVYSDNQAVRELVKSLVEKCRSVVNCPNSRGQTPLYIAVDCRNFLVMEMLLTQNADVSVQTKKGDTVLHVLATCRDLEDKCRDNEAVSGKVKFLVEKCRSVVNCSDQNGKTPPYIAVSNGNFLVVEMLLRQDADISIPTKVGNTLLHALAFCSPGEDEAVREKVRSLVEKCRSLVNRPNSSGETPLYIAIATSNFLVMEILLGEVVDVSTQTTEGNTLLHAFAASSNLDFIVRNNEALREVVRSLVEKCKSVVNSPNSGGETPLFRAIAEGNLLQVEMLGQIADISIQSKEGNTLLHFLAAYMDPKFEYGDSEASREMLRSMVEKCRCLVNCQNSSGETPIYVATGQGNFLMVEILLRENADVSIQTKGGKTVLHALAASSNVQYKLKNIKAERYIVRSLIEKCKSVVNCPNICGETPLYLAFLTGNWHVAELLLEQVGFSADSREGGLTDKPQETTGLSLAQDGADTPLHGLAASRDLHWERECDETWREKVAVWVKRFSHLVNHQDLEGYTPILIALREGNFYLAELLLQCGADLSVTDAGGGTVLHALARTAEGTHKTELTEAFKAVAVRVTELAQAAGVTPLTPNKEGKTALDLLKSMHSNRNSDWTQYLFRLWQQE